MTRSLVFFTLLSAALLTGCKDKAKEWYDTCVGRAAEGRVEVAADACRKAIDADPTSKAGIAAAAKLKELGPAIDAKKAKDKADDEARDKPEAERVRPTLNITYFSRERNGTCIDQTGLPYRKSYDGGTRAQVELVATADGCRHLFDGNTLQAFTMFKEFCCPK